MRKRLSPCLAALPIILCALLCAPALLKAAENDALLSEIDAVNVELKYLKIKLGDSKKKTKSLESKVKGKQKQIKDLSKQITALTENQALIASQAAVLLAEAEVVKAKQEILLKRFRQRIVQFYKIKQETLITSVLAAKDINDFLNRYQMVKYLLNSDKKLIESLKEQSARQTELKTSLKAQKKQLEISKKEIAKRNLKLQKEKKALNAMLSTVLLEKKVLLKREKALAKARSELEAQIASVEGLQNPAELSLELNTDNTPLTPKTAHKPKKQSQEFCWPIAEENKIKAEQTTGPNTCMSIELKPNSQILASRRGKVVYRGNISGFGNIIIIAHEKSFSTVYARLDEIWVGLGQVVEQGEDIGRILGGPNENNILHFEIRFAGKRKQPLEYLK